MSAVLSGNNGEEFVIKIRKGNEGSENFNGSVVIMSTTLNCMLCVKKPSVLWPA